MRNAAGQDVEKPGEVQASAMPTVKITENLHLGSHRKWRFLN